MEEPELALVPVQAVVVGLAVALQLAPEIPLILVVVQERVEEEPLVMLRGLALRSTVGGLARVVMDSWEDWADWLPALSKAAIR